MKKVMIFALAVMAAVAYGEKKSAVEVLTDADFDRKIGKGVWMVKMYAPWCGHCQALAPTWEAFAAESGGRFHVAEVDCPANPKACEGVNGYPTLRLYVEDEEPSEYEGERTVEALLDFVEQSVDLDALAAADGADAAPAAVTAKTLKKAQRVVAKYKKLTKNVEELTRRLEGLVQRLEEREAAAAEAERRKTSKVVGVSAENWPDVKAHGRWLVKFYAPWCPHCQQLAPTWEALATAHHADYNVAEVDCTRHEALCAEMDVHGYPTILAFADGVRTEYSGSRDLEALEEFAEKTFA